MNYYYWDSCFVTRDRLVCIDTYEYICRNIFFCQKNNYSTPRQDTT